MRNLAAVVCFLAACGGGPKEKGTAAECFAYSAPPGWHEQASKTGSDLVLGGPTEFEAGGKTMTDTFSVRFLPFPGTLDAFKEVLITQLANKDAVDKAVADNERAYPNNPKIKTGTPSAPVVTAMKLGGREAFQVDVTNTMSIGGVPLTMINRTVFAKFGPDIVSVVVGYIDTREAQVKPLQAPFLASINFDRCK
jgi:hypothetical protein